MLATSISILLMIIAILLVLVVLVQNSKGGGISSSVGISNQVMGVQRSTENVEKMTWILVGVLAVLCVFSGLAFNVKSTQAGPRNAGYEPLKTQYDMPNAPQQDPTLNTNTTTMPGGTSTGTTTPPTK